METLKKLLLLLTPIERRRAFLLLIMIIVMALIDTLGIASILPFMAVLTNPNIIDTNLILSNIFEASSGFGIYNHQDFIFALGIFVFLILLISLIFKTLTIYAQVRFVEMREYSIGKRLVEGYLHQPYSWFLSRHSADLGKTILSEVSSVISRGMKPCMELIANSIVAFAIIVLLIVFDPIIAFIVASILVASYGVIFYVVRNYLYLNGVKRLKNNQLRFTAISEAFGAIKELKVGGLEKNYVRNFSNFAKIFARTQASSETISHIPRYILEAIAFGGVLLIILYITSKTGSFNNAIPMLSLYVFAGYRLMPSLQKIYSCVSLLTFVKPSLDKLYEEIKNIDKCINKQHEVTDLSFDKKIVFNNIDYNYPNSSIASLKNINLTIKAKSKIALIGTTGSGKTTAVDIILGLLEPQNGTLEVDGKILSRNNLRSWQKLIGYVPQHIYLSDDTVEANIAFGVENKDINQDLIKKSSKIANLHNFVMDELPKQYKTIIGERGVRLSGGQKQRIGIARALYHNPKLLILDEATSALDNKTEKLVMDAINNFSKHITIVLIAHRLNTVKDCDTIFKLEKGQIVAKGNYEEIIKYN